MTYEQFSRELLVIQKKQMQGALFVIVPLILFIFAMCFIPLFPPLFLVDSFCLFPLTVAGAVFFVGRMFYLNQQKQALILQGGHVFYQTFIREMKSLNK